MLFSFLQDFVSNMSLFLAEPQKRVFTRHAAAVVIQRAWRKHIVSRFII